MEPYKIDDIILSNIVLKKTKLISNKKIIFLKYKDDNLNNFVIQLSKIENNNINNENEIEFIIDNKKYIDFFETLDDFIINKSKENYEWFNHLEDTSSMNYQRILRNNNSIKLKLCNNEELITKLIINDEIVNNFNNITFDESTSKIILEIYAIWIKPNSYGLLLRPVNISIKCKENTFYNYEFLDDSETSESLIEYDSDTDINSNNELFISNNELFVRTNSSNSSSDLENDLINKIILD